MGADWPLSRGPINPVNDRLIMLLANMASSSHSERFAQYCRSLKNPPKQQIKNESVRALIGIFDWDFVQIKRALSSPAEKHVLGQYERTANVTRLCRSTQNRTSSTRVQPVMFNL